MRMLTARQPWAALIVAGIKDVENRPWSTLMSISDEDRASDMTVCLEDMSRLQLGSWISGSAVPQAHARQNLV
jgi:hypothetical protein